MRLFWYVTILTSSLLLVPRFRREVLKRTAGSGKSRSESHHRSTLRRRILGLLERSAVYDFEELVRVCSAHTWNQVFLEVDRLSRTGEVQLFRKRPGGYQVALPSQAA